MIRIASWILQTFGSGPMIETLIGDLEEERRAGKSAVWFWGQVILGVATTFVADVRRHPLYTIRAALMTLGLSFVLFIATVYLRPWVVAAAEVYLPAHDLLRVVVHPTENGETLTFVLPWAQFVYAPILVLMLYALGAWGIGWVVRRLHPRSPTSAVLTAPMVLLGTVVGLRAADALYRGDAPVLPVLDTGWWNTSGAALITVMVALLVGGLRRAGSGRGGLDALAPTAPSS